MSKPKIYLAGAMSGLTMEEMNGWRLMANSFLKDKFETINPCDYYNFTLDKNTYSEIEVKKFDLWAVEHSDIILVNLDYPNSIGTAIELQMAFDVWHKPVVAYGGLHTNVHSWMLLNITKRCDRLDEAVTYINEYYGSILN